MSIYKYYLLSIAAFAGMQAFAQPFKAEEYSPATDPAVKKAARPEFGKWKAAYMWYPGQYASFCHRRLAEKSVERCAYVNDGGTYYTPQESTLFRREVYLPKDAKMKWRASHLAYIDVDGKRVAGMRAGEITIPAGKREIRVKVVSKTRLPCLIIEGEGLSTPEGWAASLDGKSWVPAESSLLFDEPQTTPDYLAYDIYEIPPHKYPVAENCKVSADGIEMGKNSKLVIDFKHDELGGVVLRAEGSGTLRFSVGESLPEALNDDEVRFEQKPLPSFALADGLNDIELPERALRFLRIESDGGAKISVPVFRAKLFPMKRIGKFRCSDKMFNRIFEAGAATIHTSTHDFYLDGIKRDFLPWPLDAVEAGLAADLLFDARAVSRNSYALSLLSDKPSLYNTGILDYPLHALVGFEHDFARYGEIETSLQYKDRILQMLALYESALDKNGFLPYRHSKWPAFLPGWAKRHPFPYWSGTPAYVQIMLYINWKNAAKFSERWGDTAAALKYANMAESLRGKILEHFWDGERRAFINGYDKNGKPDTEISQYTQYWAVLAGIFPKESLDNLFEKVMPAVKDYREDVSIEKPYEMLAYAKAGHVREAFDYVKDIWGGWLDDGFTRFPENFTPKGTPAQKLEFYRRPFGLSLCHASLGAPPVIVAFRGICGFWETENPNEYLLKPDLVGLDWAEGEIPVRNGSIKFRFEKSGKFEVSPPKGANVVLKFAGKTRRIAGK